MNTLNRRLLVTLLDFAQTDVRASVAHLAFEMHLPRRTVANGLNRLAQRGLIDPGACRLTMVGLVAAASLRASGLREACPAERFEAA